MNERKKWCVLLAASSAVAAMPSSVLAARQKAMGLTSGAITATDPQAHHLQCIFDPASGKYNVQSFQLSVQFNSNLLDLVPGSVIQISPYTVNSNIAPVGNFLTVAGQTASDLAQPGDVDLFLATFQLKPGVPLDTPLTFTFGAKDQNDFITGVDSGDPNNPALNLTNTGPNNIVPTIFSGSISQNYATFLNPSGNWSDPANWALGVLPQSNGTSGGAIHLSGDGGGNVVVNFDSNASATGLPSLTLDASAGRSITLQQDQGTISVSGTEIVGDNGSGTINLTGGSHTVNQLIVANNAESSGVFNLSGNGSLVVNGNENIGLAGIGTFNQSGGSHTVNQLTIANSAQSFGLFSLSGNGSLVVNGDEIVGFSGTGTFNQTANAFHIVHQLFIGNNAQSNGTFNLSGASQLIVQSNEFVGFSGTGVFNQTGGNHAITGTLFIAANAGSSGTYNLSGGILSAGGITNNGTINQSGGTINSSIINNGTFNQSGGVINASTVVNNGTLTQTGAATVSNLGAVSGTGTFSLTGGNAGASSITQSTVNIGDGTKITIKSSPSSVTNNIGALSIGSISGQLDLGNNSLLVDSTLTPLGLIRGYVLSGKTNAGNGPGIISSNLPAGYGVGYGTGAYVGTDAAHVRVLPTLLGDTKLRGTVGAADLFIVKHNYGAFNGTTLIANWQDGSTGSDGKVGAADLFWVKHNYGLSTGGSPPPPSPAVAAALKPMRLTGNPAPAPLDTILLNVNTITGDVTMIGASALLGNYDIGSPSGALASNQWVKLLSTRPGVEGWGVVGLPSNFDVAESSAVSQYAALGTLDLGNLFTPGAAHDLVFQYGTDKAFFTSVDGPNPNLGGATVIYSTPEPASMGLLGAMAVGLLSRQRRNHMPK